MNSKKQHLIAPKKSDAKKKNNTVATRVKSSNTAGHKKLNEFGDQDAI